MSRVTYQRSATDTEMYVVEFFRVRQCFPSLFHGGSHKIIVHIPTTLHIRKRLQARHKYSTTKHNLKYELYTTKQTGSL